MTDPTNGGATGPRFVVVDHEGSRHGPYDEYDTELALGNALVLLPRGGRVIVERVA